MEKKIKKSARFCSDQRGFTLPEVMITIAILGILMGIAVPSWQSVVEGRRVDSATNQFASDLRLAQSRATNRLESWDVIYQGANPGEYQLVPDGGSPITRTLPDGTAIDSTEVVEIGGNRTISFNPSGQANAVGGLDALLSDGDGKIDIVVASDDGSPSNTIQVVPATAEVEVVS